MALFQMVNSQNGVRVLGFDLEWISHNKHFSKGEQGTPLCFIRKVVL